MVELASLAVLTPSPPDKVLTYSMSIFRCSGIRVKVVTIITVRTPLLTDEILAWLPSGPRYTRLG